LRVYQIEVANKSANMNDFLLTKSVFARKKL